MRAAAGPVALLRARVPCHRLCQQTPAGRLLSNESGLGSCATPELCSELKQTTPAPRLGATPTRPHPMLRRHVCRLEALRALVPHTDRANTANFLEEVVHYVQRMQVSGAALPLSSTECSAHHAGAHAISHPAGGSGGLEKCGIDSRQGKPKGWLAPPPLQSRCRLQLRALPSHCMLPCRHEWRSWKAGWGCPSVWRHHPNSPAFQVGRGNAPTSCVAARRQNVKASAPRPAAAHGGCSNLPCLPVFPPCR